MNKKSNIFSYKNSYALFNHETKLELLVINLANLSLRGKTLILHGKTLILRGKTLILRERVNNAHTLSLTSYFTQNRIYA